MEISAKELNELLEKEFERGRNSVKVEIQTISPKTPIDYSPKLGDNSDIWVDYIPSACRTCPNHPSNGGNGICNCTLCDDVIY